jgi:hypothetical protein
VRPHLRASLPARVPHPPRACAVSLGDGIDYHQRHGHIGEVIRDTLAKLEAAGGPDAFINIKYLVSGSGRS